MNDEEKTKEELIRELQELRRRETALRLSHREWKEIFQAIGHPTMMLDPEHNVLAANRALLKTAGCSEEEIRGRKCYEIFHGTDHPPERCPLKKMLASQRFETVEMEMEVLDGVFLVSCTPILDDNNQLQKIIHTATDITDRKRAEKDILKEKNFSEAILESLPGVFYVFSHQGRFLRWNKNFESVSGYSAQELLEMKPLDFFTGDDKKSVGEAIRNVYVRGEAKVEADFVGKDGTRNPYFFSGKRVMIDETPCLLGMGIDITQLKLAEQAFKNLVSNAPIGIFIVQGGKFKLTNPGFEEITGFTEEELLNKDALMAVTPEYEEKVRRNVITMLKEKSTTPFEFQVKSKDGKTKWIMETVISTTYKGKPAILGYFMDITDLKQLENQLIHAQKMEAVGRLAGGVAHDFNNILTAIIGYGNIMKLKLGENNPLGRYIDEIVKAADRATSLTHQLLTFSRKQVVQPRVFDLNSVVKDMDKMLHRLIGEDVDLVALLDTAPVLVKADPGQIEQVIMNLVINAADAMPHGGKLTIETSGVCLDELYVKTHFDALPGTYTMLAISDTGIGMDSKTLSRIFEPYFTSKAEGKGTGLGLSIVYGIVKQSGGHISVYSEPGRGTTFKIYFPAAEKVPDAVSKEESASLLRGTETVLVVEDKDTVRFLICETLSAYGYKVLEARGGSEALTICERYNEPIHLVLTDVVMPQMSGPELVGHLRPLRPDMRTLYTSGYAEKAVFHQGVPNSNALFLQKPFKPIEMVRKVRAALDASHSVPTRQ